MNRKIEEFQNVIKSLKLKMDDDEILKQKHKVLSLYKLLCDFEKNKRSALKNNPKNGEKNFKNW